MCVHVCAFDTESIKIKIRVYDQNTETENRLKGVGGGERESGWVVKETV